MVAGVLPDRELIRGPADGRRAGSRGCARPGARARRLSRARAPRQRPSARLPRQRRLVAAAVGRDRRGRGLRARPSRQRAPRRAHALAGGDRAVRGRARESAALRERGLDRGNRLRPRDDRGDQPRRPVVRAAAAGARATRSSSPASSTTRTSCPGSSSPRRRGRRFASCRSTGAASSTSRPISACSARARASSPSPTSRTRSARCCRSRISSPPPASAGSRRWSTAPRRSRTWPWTCRRSAAISTRSPRTRCTARPASACSTRAKPLLAAMPPWQGGGDMILSVSFEGSTWNHLPHRFEAGTPNVGGAVGLGAAIDYLGRIGIARVAAHEQRLLEYATARLAGNRRARARRHGAGQVEPRVLHGRGRPSARPRHGARFARRRGSHRPSLRDAGHGILRRPGDDARLVRPLQHARGSRRAASTPSATRSGCCADGPRRPLSRRDRRPQPEPAEPRPAARRDPPCRGRQPVVRRPAQPRRRARRAT